jgi:hypothetical protein
MVKQLSSTDNNLTNDFVENSERVFKDTVKVLQTCLQTIILTKHENDYGNNKQEQTKITIETPKNDDHEIQEKELVIEDLNNKYQQASQIIDQNHKKYEEELT